MLTTVSALAPDVFADTGLANCPVNILSLSIPFYIATTDIAVEERNKLLRGLLCQVCTINLCHLHVCIDVGAESTTRAQIPLSAVNWVFVYSRLPTLPNLKIFTTELVGHCLTAADIDTMCGAIPTAPTDGESPFSRAVLTLTASVALCLKFIYAPLLVLAFAIL